MFALISNDEFAASGQMLVKQLKNRYNDPTMSPKFVVGVDRSKMRLYDTEQNTQDQILDVRPDFKPSDDQSKFKPTKSFADFTY